MQEPGCRSPTASPGWWTDQPSAGLLGRRARGSGPDAAKPVCESGLGRWTDLTSAQVRTQTAEQGVLAPAAITVRGQPGAAWNALLLLSNPRGPRPARPRGAAVLDLRLRLDPTTAQPFSSTRVMPISELLMNWISITCLALMRMMFMLALRFSPRTATRNPFSVTEPLRSPLQLRTSSCHDPASRPPSCETRLTTSTLPPADAQRIDCLSWSPAGSRA